MECMHTLDMVWINFVLHSLYMWLHHLFCTTPSHWIWVSNRWDDSLPLDTVPCTSCVSDTLAVTPSYMIWFHALPVALSNFLWLPQTWYGSTYLMLSVIHFPWLPCTWSGSIHFFWLRYTYTTYWKVANYLVGGARWPPKVTPRSKPISQL